MTLLEYLMLGGIFYFFYHEFNKRLEKLEYQKGPGETQRFSVSVFTAILNHKRLSSLVNLKSLSDGKQYNDWTEEEQDIWKKNYSQRISESTYVTFYYIAELNGYFVYTKSSQYFIRRDKSKNCLYSSIVIGDKDKQYMKFDVYERVLRGSDGKYKHVITPVITYRKDWLKGEEEFQTLFDFPLFNDEPKDEDLKQMGFEIEKTGGDDFIKDSFGELEKTTLYIDYKKNGATLSFVYD